MGATNVMYYRFVGAGFLLRQGESTIDDGGGE